jgi:hypothetical protein
MDFANSQLILQVFALPAIGNPTRGQVTATTVESNEYHVDRLCVTVPYRGKALSASASDGGACRDYPLHGYLPMCACDRSLANDMFTCIVGTCSALSGEGINPIGGGS